MPAVTRAKSQRLIEGQYVLQKNTSRSRAKSTKSTTEPPRSPRKRSCARDQENPPCSPPKKTPDENTLLSAPALASTAKLIRESSSKRVPLSPRKDIINSPVTSDRRSSPLVTASSVNSPKMVRALNFDSPSKQTSPLKNPQLLSPSVNLSPLKNLCLSSPKYNPASSPLKNMTLTSPKYSSISSPLKKTSEISSPLKNKYLPSPTKYTSLTSPKSSYLSSPSKIIPQSSPLKIPHPASPAKNLPNNSSPVKKCSVLLKSPLAKSHLPAPPSPRRVRQLDFNSPSKPKSPLKATTAEIKEGSKTSDQEIAVLPSPAKKNSKMLTPLRLAKREGLCYQRAKQAFHTTLPDKVLCREKETGIIEKFLDQCIDQKKPGSLYVSGAPGTGKTAVLSHALHRLENTPECSTVYVNCMSVRNPQAIFNKILSQLLTVDVTMTMKEASKEMEKLLCARGKMLVIILDEMDQLDHGNQEVLYTMFEWPTLPKSRLVLIGIANSLDLTDRILPRLQARPKCRPQLLNFPPYTKNQLVTILRHRLQELDGESVMETAALQFCAMKVAAVAGDVRRALDICRRAVETVESEVKKQTVLKTGSTSPSKSKVPKKIGVAHIMRIVNDVYGNRMTQKTADQTIPLQQKLTLCTLLLLLKSGRGKEVNMGKLHDAYSKVCRGQQVQHVDQSEFSSMCELIETRGIVTVKKSKNARSAKVTLKLDETELECALQDKTLLSNVLQKGLNPS